MNRFVWMFMLLCIGQAFITQQGPSRYTITADSVIIINDCDTAECIIENHGKPDLYITENSNRHKLSKTRTGQLTTSFAAPSLAANNSVTTTVSVAGAQPGDMVTVSAGTGATTLASDTYKVRVIS